MFEVLDIASIESSYQVYKNISSSRDWMMIPFFALAFSIVIPAMLEGSNRITRPRARRLMIYLAVAFFSYVVIMIYFLIVSSDPYYDQVKVEIDEYVESANCSELLSFINMYRTEHPRYIQNENWQKQIEDHYFATCGGK